ncbi:MAG: hypothetical protein KDK05_14595, partial [Candidatus Competibacteraceae bacterium]|nr:hypothetical protein [Candidatus Competibacteraceae bacterium]
MPLDMLATAQTSLIGISNDNEFYSHHYLSEVFRGDIKGLLDDWQRSADDDADFIAPPLRLRNLHRDYFALREKLGRERSVRARIELQRDFFRRLLSALDYPCQPMDLKLEEGDELPVLGLIGQPGLAQLVLLGALDPDGEGN